MLRLNLKKEPYWIPLAAGVRVQVRPLTTAVMSAAQSQVIKQIIALRELRKTDITVPDVDDEETRMGLSESLLIKSLARGAIIAWEGVMQPESDAPAVVNEQTVTDLMDIWFIAQEFWKEYSSSLALLQLEGNASGPVRHGTTPAGPATATRATKRCSPVAGASQTNAGSIAPMSSTNR